MVSSRVECAIRDVFGVVVGRQLNGMYIYRGGMIQNDSLRQVFAYLNDYRVVLCVSLVYCLCMCVVCGILCKNRLLSPVVIDMWYLHAKCIGHI